ncbi:MAG TPA: cytochrome c oxidase subunit 3, partial [Vicinamibacterales bacterium]|nr:cytochrome c oxidase subunit 3 [Vicinamibacterales bacterium]
MSNAVVHADHHAHAHHPALQHHFDTMPQQKEAAVIGMWVFLLTEILFFGGLFVAYMIYRIWYFEAFAEASRRLSIFWGALNTGVLIFSSLTMAMAVRAAQTNNRKWTVNWLVLTMILGCVFLGVKVIEYRDKFANYEVPGASYNWQYHEQHAAAEEHEA